MAKSDVIKTEAEKPDRPKVSPHKFFQQVRQEVSKVTWPSRKETVITTVMVFVFVVLMAMFFMLADQVLHWVMGFLLGLGSSGTN